MYCPSLPEAPTTQTLIAPEVTPRRRRGRASDLNAVVELELLEHAQIAAESGKRKKRGQAWTGARGAGACAGRGDRSRSSGVSRIVAPVNPRRSIARHLGRLPARPSAKTTVAIPPSKDASKVKSCQQPSRHVSTGSSRTTQPPTV